MQNPLSVSFFARAADATPRAGTVAWPDGYNTFEQVPTDPDRFLDDKYLKQTKDVHLWSAATFSGRRKVENVLSVCALVLDYDAHGTDFDPAELMDRWEKYEHVCHSTFTPGSYRVILPLDRPASREEHAALWAWAHGQDPRIDPSCKDAARAWYWPSVRAHIGRPDLDVPPVFGYNEGERLGVGGVADLRIVARPPSRSTSSTTPAGPAPSSTNPRPLRVEGNAEGTGTGGVVSSPYAAIDRAEQREDLALIESRCAFMRHARADAATLPEPEWYAALSIVARCAGGDDLAHEVSAPHPHYSYDDCEAKYQRAKTESGPRTCREIRLLSRACEGCPLQVTSPVLLGRNEAAPRTTSTSGDAAGGATPDPGNADNGAASQSEDLNAAVTEAEAAFDAARVDEDNALVAVEKAKARLRYLRTPTAIASEEDLPAAVAAHAAAKDALRWAEKARARAEKALATARARTAVAGLPPGADPVVWQRLHIVKERPAATLGNVLAILDGDPRWSSRFAYDSFSLDVCVDRACLPMELGTQLTAKLSYDYNLDTKTDLLLECMLVVAKRRQFHPVREWLDSLTWDGTPRMADLMHRGFGASPTEDDEIVRLVGERFLLSMVARVMKPGAKVDTVLILVGKQGAKKQTAFKALVGDDWFGSTDLDLANKDSYMQLRGKWLYELAEFHSVKKAEASKAKSWLSNAKDTYRAPYERRSQDHKRQSVMVASTNDEDEFLMDASGWRRYWPFKVRFTDPKWIEENRTQLFAEAVVRYRAGEQWWFDEETPEAARLQKVTSTFQAVHPWAEVIHGYVLARKTDDPFSAVDVMRQALGRQTGDLTHSEKTLVGQILRHQVRCTAHPGPTGTLYRRPSTMPLVTGPRTVVPYAAK